MFCCHALIAAGASVQSAHVLFVLMYEAGWDVRQTHAAYLHISGCYSSECKFDRNGWSANVDEQSMVHNLPTGNL